MKDSLIIQQTMNMLEMTQTELAKEIGIDKGDMSRFARGINDLRQVHRVAIYGLICKKKGKEVANRFLGHVIWKTFY